MISSPTLSYFIPFPASISLPPFWGSSSTTLFASKYVSFLKTKCFSCLKTSRCITSFSWGSSKDSLSLQPLLTYACPGWFSFLTVTNVAKLERLYQAIICVITGCLMFSSIPHLISEVSLPPVWVTLTDLTFSYKRALRLSISFFISRLARLTVKPRPRFSWRAFASTLSLTLSSTFPTADLFVCPPSPLSNFQCGAESFLPSEVSWKPSFSMELTLTSPCSCSGSHLCRKERLSPLLSLISRSGNLDWWYCSFLFRQKRLWRPCQLLAVVALRPTFPFRHAQFI